MSRHHTLLELVTPALLASGLLLGGGGVALGQAESVKVEYPDVEAKLEEPVTVTFSDTPLHFVLEEVGKRTNGNVVLAPSIKRFETRVTVTASKDPLRDVLDKVISRLPGDCQRTLWAGAIVIHPKAMALPDPKIPVRVKGARALRQSMNLQVVRSSVGSVLKRIERRVGIPTSFPARVRAGLLKSGSRLTLRLYRLPAHYVLDIVCMSSGLSWKLEDGRLVFDLVAGGAPEEGDLDVDTLKYNAKKEDLKLAGPMIDIDEVVARLRSSRSRSAATRELILIGKESLPKVAALLRAEGADKVDAATCEAALQVIAQIGDPSEYDAVLKVFKDGERSADTRIMAADTLAAIRPPQVVNDLVEALDNSTSLRLAEASRRALVSIGEPAVDRLIKRYRQERVAERPKQGVLYRALLIFGEINTNKTKRELLYALKSKRGDRAVSVRHHAAIGLGFTNDPKIIPYLIAALEGERDFLISKYITRSLSWLSDERLPPDGRRWRAWWENQGKRRYSAGESADKLLDRVAGGEIKLQLDKDGYAKINESLEQRIQRLLKMLGSDDPSKVRAASNDLEALGKDALPALRKAGENKDLAGRRAARIALRIQERLTE